MHDPVLRRTLIAIAERYQMLATREERKAQQDLRVGAACSRPWR
jgi:hypothetical protein